MKKVLITGARSGIGYAVAEELKKKNYFLYLTVHTEEQLKRIEEKYKDDSNIKCMKLDITSKKDREQIKDLSIDILINNAAIGIGGSLAELSIDQVRENFEVNVFSSFELVQQVLKQMIARKSGKIIMMGSLAGIYPLPFLGSYCGTKASIIKMTTALKNEMKLLNNNIEIKLIEPGLYATGFNRVMFDNKYPRMEEKTYFENEIAYIRLRENLILDFLQKKDYRSIVSQIVKAVEQSSSKFIYRAPLSQVIATKLYCLFCQ